MSKGALLKFIARDLSELERECLLAVVRGESYLEVAERTGWDLKQIDNAVQRARKRCSWLREAA